MFNEVVYTMPQTKKDVVLLVQALSTYMTQLIDHKDIDQAKRVSELLTELTHVLTVEE